MKTLVIILILAAFLQTTILPIDLVLIILICRAYIRSGRENLYLAFVFGLLTSHLNLGSLGLGSLIYLIAVQATQLLSKTSLSGNSLLIIPVSLTVLLFSQLINLSVSHQALELVKVIITGCLSWPVLFLVKLWEERFIMTKEIKLKV